MHRKSVLKVIRQRVRFLLLFEHKLFCLFKKYILVVITSLLINMTLSVINLRKIKLLNVDLVCLNKIFTNFVFFWRNFSPV